MFEVLDVVDAAARLPELVRKVATGNDEVFISESGTVLAKLVSVPPEARPRAPGAAKGMITLLEGWDDPMTDEELEDWFGGDESLDTDSK